MNTNKLEKDLCNGKRKLPANSSPDMSVYIMSQYLDTHPLQLRMTLLQLYVTLVLV